MRDGIIYAKRVQETCTVVYLSTLGVLRLCSVTGSRHDVVVTDPSSALSSSLKSEPTPDSTSSISSCDAASPSAKMLLSVSLLRATRCRSSSHAFDIFFGNDNDTDSECVRGLSSPITTSVSAIITSVYSCLHRRC